MPFQFYIVTPSFNQAKFIKKTIDSVLSQNQGLSYFVADGGSKDGTISILKKYAKKITWKSKKDKGQTDAINKGVRFFGKKLSKSDAIFAYLNSDDYYLPNAFQIVSDAFAAHPTKNWLVGDCQIVNQKNHVIQQPIGLYKKIWRWFFFPQLLLIANPFPQPAVFIRGKAVQKTGLFNQKLQFVMDYEYWLRLQKTSGPPIFLSQHLAAFRVHQNSKGGSQFEKQFAEQFSVVKRFTKNTFLLSLHQLHNWLTIFIYRMIK